jgi:hypothetical protein
MMITKPFLGMDFLFIVTMEGSEGYLNVVSKEISIGRINYHENSWKTSQKF